MIGKCTSGDNSRHESLLITRALHSGDQKELLKSSLELFYHCRMSRNNNKDDEASTSESSASDISEDECIKSKPPFKPISSTRKCTKSFLLDKCHKKRYNYQSKKKKETIPSNKFSSLSIFPSSEDIINEVPFLRSNIVEGKYENCEHYLDIQFRLFREDYVSPLREGIKEYKAKIKECRERFIGIYDDDDVKDVKKKLKLTYAYEDVKITNPELNDTLGIIHTLNFKPLPSTYVWKGGSRLQEGTLLCLSSDEFVNSFIFATVVCRSDDVIKGKIKVCFEEWQHDILFDMPVSKIYSMLEMRSGYFESYRHTLSVLKEFNEDNFPLKQYIVKAKQTVEAPCYLNEDTLYDFSPLLKKENFQDEKIPDNLKEVPVLDLEKWPTREELELDFTQYGVLKAALTKEFCIIQGPPGTGKTFMGLKIVKMLLHNSKVWYPENIEHECPILIVCYTNHALDQFLKKILEFTDRVVRVGDQGEDESLDVYKLKNLRSESRGCDFPLDLLLRRNRLIKKQNAIKEQINSYNFVLEAAVNVIFKPKVLKKYIREDHYNSLTSKSTSVPRIKSILEIWLKVPYPKDLEDNFNQDVGYTSNNLDIGDENIEEICSWMKWEHCDSKQQSCGWNKQVHKEHKEYIKKYMCEINMMTTEEVAAVENVWDLELHDRWRLYSFWVAKFITFIVDVVKSLQEEFNDVTKELKETRWGKDLAIVQDSNIIGMTCTGTAKFRYLIDVLSPRIVIIEEAAEVLEAHLISSLPKSTKHLILIGDHQQLRPLPSVYELAARCKLDVSLFERMVKNEVEYATLVSQHRMRPCIADLLIGPIYNELSHHESVYHYDDIVGIERNMHFLSHIASEDKKESSYCNLFEAKMVARLSRYLLLQGYEPSQITILSTYSGQVKMIKNETNKILEENKNIILKLNDVQVTTVDNYQGEENDIIIISFVRSNYEGKIGFLKTPNRVCVALSRARKGLYCIGNFEFLASESDLWKNIVAKLDQEGSVGISLTLICQNHSFKTSIEYSADFNNVFDGGCKKVCGAILKCGHICKRFCHFTDKEHLQYKCEEKCAKRCKNEHLCEKKCHEDCGDCKRHRFVQLPNCGHRVPVPCHIDDLSMYRCKESCDNMLKCGHACTKMCYESCEPCMRKIPKTLPCKHTVVIECSAYNIVCTEPCRHMLPCGHLCPKRCGIICTEICRSTVAIKLPCNHIASVPCAKQKEKIVCEASCDAYLPCGHKCPGNCAKCNQGTKHAECWRTCGKIVNNSEKCKLRCGHSNKCSKSVAVSKNLPLCFGKSPKPSDFSKKLHFDMHMVNRWKTGYNDDDDDGDNYP